MSLTIYHNPRCSKSRQTLKLIEEAGAEVDIVLYLDTPPSAAQISDLLSKLGFVSAQQLMRKGETIYKELGLKADKNKILLMRIPCSRFTPRVKPWPRSRSPFSSTKTKLVMTR